jgi:hypothetical protein
MQVRKPASFSGTFNLIPGVVERKTKGEGAQKVQIVRKYVAARFPEVRGMYYSHKLICIWTFHAICLPTPPFDVIKRCASATDTVCRAQSLCLVLQKTTRPALSDYVDEDSKKVAREECTLAYAQPQQQQQSLINKQPNSKQQQDEGDELKLEPR